MCADRRGGVTGNVTLPLGLGKHLAGTVYCLSHTQPCTRALTHRHTHTHIHTHCHTQTLTLTHTHTHAQEHTINLTSGLPIGILQSSWKSYIPTVQTFA